MSGNKLPRELEAIRMMALYSMGESVEGEGIVENPAVLIIKGNEMYRKGDYDSSYKLYKEAYEKDKNLIEAKINMGFSLIKLRKYEEARQIFESLPDDLRNEYILNSLGNIYARKGEYEKAEEYYKKAIMKNMDFILPKLNIAQMMLSKGDAEKSYEYLNKMESIPQRYRGIYLRTRAFVEYFIKKYEDSLEHIREYLKENENDSGAWLLASECEGILGKKIDAEKSAKRAYDLEKSTVAMTALSSLKLENGDVDKAMKMAEEIIKKDNKNGRAYTVLAKGNYIKGDYKNAFEYSTKALNFRDDLYTHLLRGESARRLGYYEEAKKEADKILEKKGDFRNAKILKAIAIGHLGDYEEAIRILDELKEEKEDFLLWTSYSDIYSHFNKKRKCVESLENALKYKESVEHMKKLCVLLYELKDFEKLEKYVKRLVEIKSEDAYVWYLRGESLFLKNMDEAEKCYKMAVEIDDKFMDAYIKLLIISIRKDDMDSFKNYVKKLISLSPSVDIWKNMFSVFYDLEYYNEIIKYVDKAIEETSDESLRIYEIKSLIKIGRYEESLKSCEKILEKIPNYDEAVLYKGISYYYLGRYAESLQIMEKMKEKYEIEANYYIARIYFDTGRAVEAMEIAEKYGYEERFMFLKMDILLSLKSYDELLDYINSNLSRLKGKSLTRALFYRMKIHFEREENKKGFETGEEILERDPENYETLIFLSEKYLESGDYNMARDLAKRAMDIRETEESLFIYASSSYSLGFYEESLNYVDKLIEKKEKIEYLLLKSKILYSLNRYEDCISTSMAILEKGKNEEAEMLIGKSYYGMGKYEEAESYFEDILAGDMENRDALYYISLSLHNMGEPERAVQFFERAIEKYEKVPKDLIENYAESLFMLERYDSVINILENFEEKTPFMYLILGKTFYNMEDYKEAVDYLNKIEDEKLDGEKKYYLALCYINLGNYEDADYILSSFKEEKGDILYYHALALFKLSNYEDALEKFRKYSEEGNKDVNFYIALCLYNLGKYEESIKFFELGEKENEESLKYEALAYVKIKDYENASKFFNICKKKDLMTPEMWYLYALSLENLGKKSLKYYERAWKEGFRNEEIAYKLVNIYYERGEFSKAEEFANEAAKYGKEGRLQAAKVYMENGKFEDAYKLLEGLEGEDISLLRGKLLIKLERYNEAERILKDIWEVPEASYELSKLLVKREKYLDAMNYINKGEEFGDLSYERMLCYFKLEKWEEAGNIAEKLMNSGKNVREATRILGLSLFSLKKYKECVNYLEKSREFGENVDYYLGISYYNLENYEKAIKYLENCGSEVCKRYKAMSFYNLNKYEDALKIFRELDTEESREYSGICAYKIGNYNLAIEYLKGNEKYREELAESYFMMEKYEEVIELNPKNKRLLGLSYFYTGRYEEAIKILNEIKDKSGEIYYYLSISSLQIGEYDNAKNYMEMAKKNGYEEDVSAFEGFIAYKMGKYDDAIKLLKESKKYGREYGISLYHTGRYREAIDVLKEYDDDGSLRYLGLSMKELGERIDKAIEIFTKLGDNKNLADCYLRIKEYEKSLEYIGDYDDEDARRIKFEDLINLKRYEEAVKVYEKMSKDQKERYSKDICQAYISLKRYDEAEDIMNKYFMEDFDWLYLRAMIEIAKKNYSDALISLNKAKKINPDDVRISKILAPLLLNTGKVNESIKEAKRAVKNMPNDEVCWYNLGAAYHRKGEEEMAIEAIKKSVKINPQFWEAWNLLGVIYLNKGDYENSYDAFSRIEKKDREIMISLAGVCYQLEKYDEALDYINTALKMRKDYKALYYHALILIELGKKEEAVEELRKVIKMKPQFVKARKVLGELLGGE